MNRTPVAIFAACVCLAAAHAGASASGPRMPAGTCASTKDPLVEAVARDYGATLRWIGHERDKDTLELYTSARGWALIRNRPDAVLDRACLVDAGDIERVSERFDCDADSSIDDLVTANGPMEPVYWARSVAARRAYVLYVERGEGSSGRWAMRGSNPQITGLPTPISQEPCATVSGGTSTTIRAF